MDTRRRPVKRLSSPERWEAKQLIASGVLPVEEYPMYDAENDGLLAYEEEAEQEVEVEINEDEAPFLAGQTGPEVGEVSPIKIVKNPDGSLQRAAMTQSALAKERWGRRRRREHTHGDTYRGTHTGHTVADTDARRPSNSLTIHAVPPGSTQHLLSRLKLVLFPKILQRFSKDSPKILQRFSPPPPSHCA